VIDGVTRPQRSDDTDRLLEHAEADISGRPTVPENVLVERLAGADSQGEPSAEEQRRRGRRLREDRRMDAHDRARDADADTDPFGGVGGRAQH